MRTFLIYSFCKINLSLRIIKKLNTGLHQIRSKVTFANLFDIIKIKEINSTKDQIKFYGKFRYNINLKNNTISKTLDILRQNNYLKKKLIWFSEILVPIILLRGPEKNYINC